MFSVLSLTGKATAVKPCQTEVSGEMVHYKRTEISHSVTAYRETKGRQLTTGYPDSSPGGRKMHFTLIVHYLFVL